VSRFLFVVPPLAGHVNPTVAVGRELAGRGHEVAWCGAERTLRPLVGGGALVLATGTKLFRAQGEGGQEALRSLWEGFVVPHARFTLPAVERAVRDFAPDVVVVDEHAPAGAIAAHRRGLVWATSATSATEIGDAYGAYPGLGAWVAGLLAGLWERAGLPADGVPDPRASPWLTLAFSVPGLVGVPRRERCALVGPAVPAGGAPPAGRDGGAGPGPGAFPWERLDPGRRRVLVTMGTLAADLSGGFLGRVLDAVGPLAGRVQAVVVAPPDPRAGAPARIEAAGVPGNVLAVPWAPVPALMPRMDAVLCHGGLNTVGEALAHGVPLVIAPIRHDQPLTAARVAAAGAGVRVGFADASPEQLRAALETVLGEGAHRQAAARLGRELAAAGGAARAAGLLQELAASGSVDIGPPAYTRASTRGAAGVDGHCSAGPSRSSL
jgi:UDP:flavonoid glycosyltransferase YjiC (YdhE family)